MRGFALVITLMLMVLLTILALGLLGLSSISLRTSGHSEALAAARANARLSLALAIGQLQKQAGCDTRVTARADILDEDHPLVLGAWKSWEGSDHETTGNFAGRPISPRDYKSAKQARFLGWFTSSNLTNPTTLPEVAPGKGRVTLVGSGSVGTKAGGDKAQIHLDGLPVHASGQSGNIAWWTGGENQKARLPKRHRPDSDTSGRWAALAKSHAAVDPKPFRLDTLLNDAAPADKALTLQQADLIATADSAKASDDFFYDLSAVSVGLLTNTATGGWRKDLSLLTENWSNQPSSKMPMFRVTPQKDLQANRATSTSPLASGSMLYPWATYRSGNVPIYQLGPVSSWENLVNFATFYKRVSASSSGRFSTNTYSSAIGGNSFNFIHKVRILPVIARTQWVFSHSAGTPTPATSDNRLEPRLLVTPVITMWNPYNVELVLPSGNDANPCLSFVLDQPFPVALKYYINGVANPGFNAVMGEAVNNQPSMGAARMRYSIPTLTPMKPGETRIFSPANSTPVPAGTNVPLKVGYRTGGGNYYPVRNAQGQTLALPGTTTIKADAKFDTEHVQYAELAKSGVGIVLDMQVSGSTDLAYRGICTSAVAKEIYPPLDGLAEATLNECKNNNPSPFLSTMFGARMASRTHIAAKGFVQSSPLVNYTAMGKDEVEWSIRRDYAGTDHPVNSPFDYSFVAHTQGDSLLPNASDASGRGYIVTGFSKADGLSRCIIAELPTRPLASLGELVNWDLRFDNPIPPFAFNLIGNSDASPLLPANAVVNTADVGLTVNLQYDDSYCANHLLFDDWFLSSIAPDPNEFGITGRNQRAVFTDLVTGLKPLPNQSYKPIAEDLAVGSSDSAAAGKLFTDQVSKTDSWKKIASRLEVEGMFNVNSTSVRAWRALLGHARNQLVPQDNEAGTSWNTQLSSKKDHPVTRFSIAGDAEAGEASSSGSFPEANEFAGYRTLDDNFLDTLAEEVVEQVRLRGPFLSLSEFVNRQLSSGNLALAGALQTALNEAAKSSNNIFATVEALSTPSVAVPKSAGQTGYKFPAAAVGYSGYGLPGWTRQADILRPLAPVLSARDDTFTIRGYGDARDGKGAILATAVCEAVLSRTRDFLDPTDLADITTEPTTPANKQFGRRFQIVSFRWLTADEV